MTIGISPLQPSMQAFYCKPCEWISEICKTVHDLAMRIINRINEYFTKTTEIAVNPITTGPMTLAKNLILFYRGVEANNNQVTLDQILSWDDGQLEAVHNYIQWLFPTNHSSGPNPTAPVLDSSTIQAFRGDSFLKNQLLRSFRRMLAFYGLQMDETTRVITRASNFNARAAVWLTYNNHNFLRITRIIHSMNLLGLSEYSRAFQTIMLNIAQNEGSGTVSNDTLRYWQRLRY
jgi:hypothetical protein